MKERQENRGGKPVTVVEREAHDMTDAELLRAALAELQAEMQRARPGWKPTVPVSAPRTQVK